MLVSKYQGRDEMKRAVNWEHHSLGRSALIGHSIVIQLPKTAKKRRKLVSVHESHQGCTISLISSASILRIDLREFTKVVSRCFSTLSGPVRGKPS